MRFAMLVFVLGAAACGPMQMGKQAKAFNHPPLFAVAEFWAHAGKLDAGLVALKDGEVSQSAASRWPKVWIGYDGSKMCIYEPRNEPLGAGETAAGQTARYARMVAARQVLFAAHDSFEAIPEAFPSGPASSENRVSDEDFTSRTHYDSDGDKRTTYYTGAKLVYCGPAPAITASTRVITAALYRKGEDTELYAWEIEGAPAAHAGAPPPRAASDGPETSTDNLVDTLKARGGYLGFLTVVDCASKREELASGKLNVMAFSDATILRAMPDKDERMALKRKPAECLAIYNAHVGKRVSSDGKTLQATGLDGKERQVKLDRSLPVVETTNGTIYPVPEMWRP